MILLKLIFLTEQVGLSECVLMLTPMLLIISQLILQLRLKMQIPLLMLMRACFPFMGE